MGLDPPYDKGDEGSETPPSDRRPPTVLRDNDESDEGTIPVPDFWLYTSGKETGAMKKSARKLLEAGLLLRN